MIPQLHEVIDRHVMVHVQVVSLDVTADDRIRGIPLLALGLPGCHTLIGRRLEQVVFRKDVFPVVEYGNLLLPVHIRIFREREMVLFLHRPPILRDGDGVRHGHPFAGAGRTSGTASEKGHKRHGEGENKGDPDFRIHGLGDLLQVTDNYGK